MQAIVEKMPPAGDDREGAGGAALPAGAEIFRFDYSGQDVRGDSVSYYVYASSHGDARRILEGSKIKVEDLWLHQEPWRSRFRRKKVTRAGVGAFSKQLGERVRADEPLRQAVQEIARSSVNPLLRAALFEVAAALRDDLVNPADAFGLRFDKEEARVSPADIFPPEFRNILRAGLARGNPSDMLFEYGEAQIRTAQNISKLVGSLYYPGVVLGLASVVVILLCAVILPQMEEFYNSLLDVTRGALPLPTRVLLGLSRFLVSVPGILSLLGVAGPVIFGIRKARTPEGRRWVQRRNLHWPLAGPLLRTLHAGYAIHMMAVLASVKTPAEFLQETAAASPSVVYREKLESIRAAFREGGLNLETAFAPYAFLFGDEFQPVLATAERGGNLPVQLAYYARLLEKQFQEKVERMSKLVEPCTLAVAGLVIGFIVIAAYYPLFSLIGEMANRH